MKGFEEQTLSLSLSLSLSHPPSLSSMLLVCFFFSLKVVSVNVPEEPFNELLLLRLSILKDGQRDGGGVVLVFRKADAGDPFRSLLVALRPVELLQILQKLGLCADPSLSSVSAVEEGLLTSEYPVE